MYPSSCSFLSAKIPINCAVTSNPSKSFHVQQICSLKEKSPAKTNHASVRLPQSLRPIIPNEEWYISTGFSSFN